MAALLAHLAESPLASTLQRLGSGIFVGSASVRPEELEADGELDDQELEDLANLERMRRAATEACLREVVGHLDSFLADYARSTGPPPAYEDWVSALHPENTKAGVVDHRFYDEKADHRRLWNAKCAPERRVAAAARPSAPPPAARAPDVGGAAAATAAPPDVASPHAQKLRQLEELRQLRQQLEHLVLLRSHQLQRQAQHDAWFQQQQQQPQPQQQWQQVPPPRWQQQQWQQQHRQQPQPHLLQPHLQQRLTPYHSQQYAPFAAAQPQRPPWPTSPQQALPTHQFPSGHARHPQYPPPLQQPPQPPQRPTLGPQPTAGQQWQQPAHGWLQHAPWQPPPAPATMHDACDPFAGL